MSTYQYKPIYGIPVNADGDGYEFADVFVYGQFDSDEDYYWIRVSTLDPEAPIEVIRRATTEEKQNAAKVMTHWW